jgi:aryl-alcohol dehydrogenase-like predicted oxidoreductase
METEFRDESIVLAQTIKAHAEKKGLTATQFALSWLLANQIVSSVIAGPRTFEQWTDYLAAVDIELDDEDEQLIDSLVRPGHPSTPGYNDPQYPFYGRIVD